MPSVNNPIRSLTLNGVDAAQRFCQISLNSAEQLMSLNLALSKQCLDQQVKVVRDMTGVSDPQELCNRMNHMASQSFEQAISHSRNVYDVIAHTQEELSQLISQNFEAFKNSLTSSFGTVGQNAPAGADVAFNAVKSGIAAVADALSSFSKAAKQTTEMADAGFKATMNSTPATAAKTSKRS